MTRLLRYLTLPREVSAFEASYLQRMNRIALGFFWLHPPAFALVAYLSGTSIAVALVLSAVAMVGPTFAYVALSSRPRVVGLIYGFTAMMMGGVLVYIGQGPMQIEMHFYFFVLIALLAVFGNPMVIVIAAVTVAAHHLVVWLVLPEGVFNYDASVWAVAVHAIFVVLESVAACFVARSFFDNVIGLEKIVTGRTDALDARNRDMALILDNVAQGFVTVGFDGTIGAERSSALTRWFGEPAPGARWWDYCGHTPELAAWIKLGFDGLVDDFMPASVVLDQMPKRMARNDREYGIEYKPIGEPATALLIVVSDITDEVARHRAEASQRELIAVVEKASRDRAGFLGFTRETQDLISKCLTPSPGQLAELKRHLHTLKGNAGLFGATSIAELCHQLEGEVEEQRAPLDGRQRQRLAAAWQSFRNRIEPVLGISKKRALVVDWDDYQSVLPQLATLDAPAVEQVRRWGLDPTRPHLERLAEQARALVKRLDKGELHVSIEDHGARVDGEYFQSVWSAIVHAVRNAVDHGIEPADARRAAGKPAHARIRLVTRVEQGNFVLEVIDDGAGIDWVRVAARARELGLPAVTPRELEEAAFASGVSTAAQMTDVSGRGVGLDALRTACRLLGGSVQLISERGAGSTVRCVMPVPARHATAHLVAVS